MLINSKITTIVMPYIWAALGIIVCILILSYYRPGAFAHAYYPPELIFGDCDDARSTGCGFGA
jgi:hypothetical protein